jgi:putative spermidine/putrescine transport system permease protein
MKNINTQAGSSRWPSDKFVLAIVLLYLIVPLGATFSFAFTSDTGFNPGIIIQTLRDADFSTTLLLSFALAISSTLLAVMLVAPTAYWVRLRLPQARPLLEFLSLLPFAVPPIILSLGYLEVYGDTHTWIDVLSLGLVPLLSNAPFTIVDTPQLLVCAYVVIALPFTYRPIDNNLRALNTQVLSEAGASLGCGWWRTFFTIILPNLWPGITSAALLTFSTAMGEFTIAVLSGIYTFPVYLDQAGQNDPHKAAFLTIFSFLIMLICVLTLIMLVHNRSEETQEDSMLEVGAGR